MSASDSEASSILSNVTSFMDHELVDESLDLEQADNENIKAGRFTS